MNRIATALHNGGAGLGAFGALYASKAPWLAVAFVICFVVLLHYGLKYLSVFLSWKIENARLQSDERDGHTGK